MTSDRRYIILNARSRRLKDPPFNGLLSIKDSCLTSNDPQRFVIADTLLGLVLPSFSSEELNWFQAICGRMNDDYEDSVGVSDKAYEYHRSS